MIDRTQTRIFLDRVKFTGYLMLLAGTGFSNSFCSIGLGVYTVAYWLEDLYGHTTERPAMPHLKWLLALGVSLTVSAVFSTYPEESLRGLLKYIQGFWLLYASMDLLRDPKKLWISLKVLLAVFFLASIDGLTQQLWGKDLLFQRTGIPYDDVRMRMRGPYSHSNDFGTFLVMSFGAAIPFIWNGWKKNKTLFGAGLVVWALSAYMLIQTISRAAFIGYGAACVSFLFLMRPRKSTVLVAAALCAAVLFLPTEINRRLYQGMDLKHADMPERILLLKTAARMVQASPLFGLGVNTYAKNFPDYRPADYDTEMSAHNAFLQMATEIGLVGLFLYLGYLVLLMRSCVPAARSLSADERLILFAVLASAVGFLVNCLFDSALQSTKLRYIFWVYLGIACTFLPARVMPKK